MSAGADQCERRCDWWRLRLRTLMAALVLTAAGIGGVAAPAHAADVVVYAAASLTNALAEVGHVYEQDSNNNIRFSFASSSILARQIAEGAPADIYASANIKWMDYVEQHDAIMATSRRRFVANQLVLVAPRDSAIDEVDIAPGFALADLLGDGRLAIANPQHVPAGIYAKQSLQALGVWDAVKDRLVRGSNVRVTLNYVANGGIPLGIVYSTDAAVADDVKIVGIFPAASHAPIVYTVALTQAVGKKDTAARDFFAFMASDTADAIMARYGFKVLD